MHRKGYFDILKIECYALMTFLFLIEKEEIPGRIIEGQNRERKEKMLRKEQKMFRQKSRMFVGLMLAIMIASLLFMLMGTVAFAGEAKSANGADAEEKVIEEVADLPGARIGVQLGTTGDIYASDYEGDDAGTTITRYNKGTDAIQALKQKKLDCVIIDEQPAKAFVGKNSDLSILEEDFAQEDYAICIAKGNDRLKEKINRVLQELKEDGTLQNIINNYIGDDTKGKSPYTSPDDVEYSNGTLTMGTNVAFPPYEYYENGKPVGIDVDMAQALADRLGMKLKIVDMEFDSVIIAVQQGKVDIGVSGMTVTEERLKNIDFSESYTTAKQVVIVRNGSESKKATLLDKINQSFLEDNRWQYIVQGLKNTIIVTLLAGIIGIILGFIVAVIRTAYERNEHRNAVLSVLNTLVKLYLTVFRGIPMMTQLLIMFYVIFGAVDVNPVVASVLAFGLNSGAYVAEAIRAGIIAIPVGQFEAGRSLGFTYEATMRYIILPQAVKNALPAMCNEFIALLKETSIVGYVGLIDLNKAGDIIRSNTYEALVPLVFVALIYLAIVVILTKLVGILERRLKKNAR